MEATKGWKKPSTTYEYGNDAHKETPETQPGSDWKAPEDHNEKSTNAACSALQPKVVFAHKPWLSQIPLLTVEQKGNHMLR